MSDGKLDIIDPHCVPVVPGHDLQTHILPNGNVMLTLLTHQVQPDGEIVAVVTCRAEWQPEKLKAVHRQLMAVMEAGALAMMETANVLAS